jgi:GT2 family glycosyltransferase
MRQLRGFDPRFFLYWEETDLCRRAQDAGFEVWALGAAVAHHVVGESSRGEDARFGRSIAKHYYQSRYYYMVKHHGVLAATSAELAEFLLLGAEAFLDLVRARGLSRLRPRLKAAPLTMPERISDDR